MFHLVSTRRISMTMEHRLSNNDANIRGWNNSAAPSVGEPSRGRSMELVAIVTILSVLQYAVFAVLVSFARKRTGIVAPQISGHPEFERYFRVQQNTLERLVIFVPALWVFSTYVNPSVGASLGAL